MSSHKIIDNLREDNAIIMKKNFIKILRYRARTCDQNKNYIIIVIIFIIMRVCGVVGDDYVFQINEIDAALIFCNHSS